MVAIDDARSAGAAVVRRAVPGGGAKRLAALDGTPSAAAAAQVAFASLTQDCRAGSAAVNATTWGRFSNSGSCTYDCGFMEQDWNWWFDITMWGAPSQLLGAVTNVNIGDAYTNAFAPTAAWVGTDLPGYSTSFTAATTTITQIDAAITKAGGSETPEQAAQLSAAFTNAAVQVTKSLNKANGALQSLAAFDTGQQPAGYLPAFLTTLQSSADSWIARLRDNLIGQLACGSGDVTGQYAAAQAVVDASFGSLTTPFATLDAQFQAALQNVSKLAGIFLLIQSDSTEVTEQLALAQTFAPDSPLRTMHLSLASGTWGTLTAEAQAQLTA
jgi:hypothetical protein